MPTRRVKTTDRNGNVRYVTRKYRKRKPKRRKQKAFDLMKMSNPKSSGNPNKSFSAIGLYSGGRIMRASQKIHKQHTNEIELNYDSPVDYRANPQLCHVK